MNDYSKKILQDLINNFYIRLDEIAALDAEDLNSFIYGEQSVYLRCLKHIQEWDKNKELGIDFDIDEKYPLR